MIAIALASATAILLLIGAATARRRSGSPRKVSATTLPLSQHHEFPALRSVRVIRGDAAIEGDFTARARHEPAPGPRNPAPLTAVAAEDLRKPVGGR
ncbi:MAG: hypothetical protein ACYDEN_05205 [Acidimicrobiales bacterium]